MRYPTPEEVNFCSEIIDNWPDGYIDNRAKCARIILSAYRNEVMNHHNINNSPDAENRLDQEGDMFHSSVDE